tara:strand:+ start:201 stop:383 length:183 start_codon:yes stop_codon:yes gene_type:complete
MVNIREVIAELSDIIKSFETGLGSDELIRLAECIEALASISLQIRGIGEALKRYGVKINE